MAEGVLSLSPVYVRLINMIDDYIYGAGTKAHYPITLSLSVIAHRYMKVISHLGMKGEVTSTTERIIGGYEFS